MPPEFAITAERIDAVCCVVAVRGELDMFTGDELKQVLADAIESGRIRIVLDLSETTFIDSAALGVPIGALKRLHRRGGALAIVNVDENLAKTFEITGLDQLFTIRATRDEAFSALDGAAERVEASLRRTARSQGGGSEDPGSGPGR